MTRYARGNCAKGCSGKQKNHPTVWSQLKAQPVRRSERDEVEKNPMPNKLGVIIRKPVDGEQWFDFNANRKNVVGRKIVKMKSGIAPASHSKNRNGDTVSVKSDKINSLCTISPTTVSQSRRTSKADNRGVFGNGRSYDDKSTSKIKTEGVASLIVCNSVPRFNIDSSDKIKLRQKEKALKREKKKVCFCCRRWGHQLTDCPEFMPVDSSDVSPPAGGICYHCGSTEHNIKQCSKPGVNSLKYARCFVCGEDGHLARQCKSNPKGNYPKGGACRICGEVSHLCSECPNGVDKTSVLENFLSCTTEGPVDSLPEDSIKNCLQNLIPRKFVQFS
ncbi:uncharacterized protein [Hetaerina americana]|uniref:uncharacterized protein n=1 Tax=Hetaerina americana TaxID=62018 RepID=UPI003A7F3B0F